MATKIFDFTALSAAIASGDLLVLVDVSDPTGDGNGTTKKMTISDFLKFLPVFIPEITNTETLAANKTLVDTDVKNHRLDPGGSGRDVSLPAESSTLNHSFTITNTADVYSEDLAVKDDSPATIITVRPGETATLWSDGTNWKGEITANQWIEVQLTLFAAGSDHGAGDDAANFRITPNMAGWNMALPHAQITGTNGTTGTLDIQLRNDTQAADILSTKLTVDTGEDGSDTAVAAAVVNTSEDDLQENDVIACDVDAVHSGTAGKGLNVTIPLWKPL